MSWTASEPDRRITTRQAWGLWDTGEGPAVLCLHGFPDHPIGLEPLASELAAAGYRVITPALPGYPPTEPAPDGDYAVPVLAADVVELLNQLEIERVFAIGHDWGAEIAYELGASHQDRVRGLVTIAAPHPAGYALRHTAFAEQQTMGYALFLAFAESAPAVASDPKWLTSLAQWAAPSMWRADWPEVLDVIANEGVLREVCRYYRCDLETSRPHRAVEVPSTVIYGGQDGAIGPHLFDALEAWFPAGLSNVLIPRAGHWPHVEAPERSREVILAAVAAAPE